MAARRIRLLADLAYGSCMPLDPRPDRSRGSGGPSPGARRFELALGQVRAMSYRDEFTITETPGPARLAPHSFALSADVQLQHHAIGSGRLVILFDPAGQPTWEGTLRAVAYVDADVDLEIAADPMLPDVGWSWLTEALEQAGAEALAVGGTVTQVASRSFGVMGHRDPEGRLQVRVSWTPLELADLPAHVRAWATLMALACGLPLEGDVAALRR